ncbi:hypothetical protein D3C85_1010750 [compost metagenome]
MVPALQEIGVIETVAAIFDAGKIFISDCSQIHPRASVTCMLYKPLGNCVKVPSV